MLALATTKTKKIVAARNCHRALINVCALLDLDVEWVYPEYENGSVLSGEISVESIERGIKSAGNPAAVYITSPDYLGRIYDVKGISELCKKYEIPLLVDNAHGACLGFLEESQHPIHLGAAMCCDSAHKTLPALTGAGYLHIADQKYVRSAKDMMSLFASTSPSYLTICSLDLCNRYIAEDVKDDLKRAINLLDDIKSKLSGNWKVLKTEPLRLTLYTLNTGRYAKEIAEILRKDGIECEYADDTHIVFMFSPLSDEDDFERLYNALQSIRMPRIMLPEPLINLPKFEKAISIREAVLSPNEEIPIEQSVGRICGKTKITCPPGVAIIASGEVIHKESINILKRYSISSVNVVK